MKTGTLIVLTVYAVAMALLEAAVVVYLRKLYYPENPLLIFPLHFLREYDVAVELSRELATIVMLITVAALVEGKSLTRGFAVFVYLFGVWDIFYYVWLKVLLDWPQTWFEWDVLFLIPMLWLGPWICPVLIAVLFVVWGLYTLRSPQPVSFSAISLSTFGSGALLGLASFFQPAAQAWLEGGQAALVAYTPGTFWWWLFLAGLTLMASGLGMTLRPVKGPQTQLRDSQLSRGRVPLPRTAGGD